MEKRGSWIGSKHWWEKSQLKLREKHVMQITDNWWNTMAMGVATERRDQEQKTNTIERWGKEIWSQKMNSDIGGYVQLKLNGRGLQWI